MARGFYFFVAGLSAGAGAMLLYTPRSGRENRRFIKKKSAQLADSANDYIERGRDTVNRTSDAVTSAIKSGKEALASRF